MALTHQIHQKVKRTTAPRLAGTLWRFDIVYNMLFLLILERKSGVLPLRAEPRKVVARSGVTPYLAEAYT